MKTCPFCNRPIPDQAAVCPHAGCGQPLSDAGSPGAAPRPRRAPPPPPGRPVAATDARQTPAAVPPGASRSPLANPALWFSLAAVLFLAVLLAAWWTTRQPPAVSKGPTVPAATPAAPAASPAAPSPQAVAGAHPAATPGHEELVAMPTGTTPAVATGPEQTGIYALRTSPRRQQLIAEFGATTESENAVAAGLRWLARHQAEDGHWGPDCLRIAPVGRCKENDRCPNEGQNYAAAQSGLALLAFQAGGQYAHNNREHSQVVARGLDWLVAHQADDGAMVTSGRRNDRTYMYEHGIAAFALSEACAVALAEGRKPDDRYRAAAEKAVYFILTQQHNDGGWRYNPNLNEGSDTSVSGWQVLALKTAQEAKFQVTDDCLTRLVEFFKRCELDGSPPGRTGYQPGHAISDATTGVGMLVHAFILHKPADPLMHDASAYLADLAERSWKVEGNPGRDAYRGKGDFYTWYNCTLGMCQAGGENWKRWNDVVRDMIIKLQIVDKDRCTEGSWDPEGRWDSEGGRIYCTALAILTLEVYYRYKSDQARVYADLRKEEK